jgi:hypothetical protein
MAARAGPDRAVAVAAVAAVAPAAAAMASDDVAAASAMALHGVIRLTMNLLTSV